LLATNFLACPIVTHFLYLNYPKYPDNYPKIPFLSNKLHPISLIHALIILGSVTLYLSLEPRNKLATGEAPQRRKEKRALHLHAKGTRCGECYSKVPKWRDPKLVLGGVGRERDERTGETTWLIVNSAERKGLAIYVWRGLKFGYNINKIY
jgi:hypothetical protein